MEQYTIQVNEKFFVASDFDADVVGQGVHHGNTDAVEATRGLIGFTGEFAARVEGAKDHFERRFVRELRMRIDGDAPAIVAHGDGAVLEKFDFDAVGVACDSLVHRVIQNFGHEVVERAFVGAADIHAGAFAHGFQTLENLD